MKIAHILYNTVYKILLLHYLFIYIEIYYRYKRQRDSDIVVFDETAKYCIYIDGVVCFEQVLP